MKFTINGIEFWIDEFCDGFAWVSKTSEGNGFPTIWEAQQDALNYMQNYGFEKDNITTRSMDVINQMYRENL